MAAFMVMAVSCKKEDSQQKLSGLHDSRANVMSNRAKTFFMAG